MITTTWRRWPLVSIALVLALATAWAVEKPTATEPAAPVEVERAAGQADLSPAQRAVDAEVLLAHIRHLADDALEGRAAGSKGGRKAGDYLAAQFKRLGLEPAGTNDEGYFQTFTRPRREVDPKKTKLTLTVATDGEPNERTLELDKGFEPFGFSGSGKAAGEVVFAGYGITAPEHEYDDYANIDVKGKIVAILRYAPAEGDDDGPFSPVIRNRHAYFTRKLENARKHGAAGVILFTGAHYHPKDADELMASRAQGAPGRKLPYVQATHSAMKRFFDAAGVDIDAVQKKIDETLSPMSFAVEGGRATMAVGFESNPVEMRNVCAMLPGSDPELKDEVVVIGAHYDHVGMRPKRATDKPGADRVFNGADDNASGCAGALAIAEALIKADYRPKRSVLFLLFDAEEIGLVGSNYFVTHPTVPREKIAAMINMDMIGRSENRSVYVGGVGSAEGLKGLVREVNRAIDLKVRTGDSAYGPSDHMNFARRDIPVLFVNTGTHADLHRVSDEVEKIDEETAADVTRLVTGIAQRLAEGESRPEFAGMGRPAMGGMARRRGAYLGVGGADAEEGVQITQVAPGSPAAKGGLEPGDLVTKVDDTEIDSFRALAMAIVGHKPGDKVTMTVRRDDEPMELEVTLGKR